MRYFIPAALLLLLFVGCSMHAVKHPMAGTWYSTIDDVGVLLELVIVDKTVSGSLELLEDVERELPKGTMIDIMESSCKEGSLRFYLDIDRDGKLSKEDVFMNLHLEGKERLTGFGHERDDPDNTQKIIFTRAQ